MRWAAAAAATAAAARVVAAAAPAVAAVAAVAAAVASARARQDGSSLSDATRLQFGHATHAAGQTCLQVECNAPGRSLRHV